ncbi:MFS transporter [Thiohalomonas denitrificans]|uniref:MFS transporter, UMF1 family n=1 Tax=Thiohalomonas denitrificans TaxID=415747 RepID=A0A1G5QMW6_9GAMM|nr:MFS transporter [Thiohalomonas denitrificans]SCZ62996.1 MFS transporter, UMF1 family [Thiohalomonas denitrificans]
MLKHSRSTWSWALYDWANSAFATTVMAGFFPVFFKQYWAVDLPDEQSTFWLGLANSLSSLLIVALAPLLGAVADCWGARKKFLLTFTTFGVLMTALMPWVGQGEWLLAALLYFLATVGFSGSLGFYDSLIVFITRPEGYDRVSAFGFSLGYLGGGLLFAFNVWMTVQPEFFGLADASEAVRLSFITVALWWALFTLPLSLFVKERPGRHVSALKAARGGWRQLRETFRHLRALRMTFYFLLAYWLYIDAVDTIVRMAVDYGLALGLAHESLLMALLITQFVGVPAALIFGRIGERIGPKNGIYIALAVYTGVVFWAMFMETAGDFYAMAVTIGLVQGGLQSLSRSLYARLIPPDKSGEFFGFFNMMSKFAAVFGPVMVGVTGVLTGSNRASLVVLLVLFGAGAWFLSRVDVEAGRRAISGHT